MKAKNTLTFLMVLCSLHVFAQSNLIACYPLNNNAYDFSGNNYNGTAYNLNPDTDRFGHLFYAYNFSGNGSGVLVNDSAFHLNKFTYSAWCKLSSLPSAGQYFSLIAIGGVIADQAVLIGNNPPIGHVGFGFGSWDTIPTPHHCYQGFLPNVNQWYHMVCTRDNDSLKLYIDNNLICVQSTGKVAGYLGPYLSLSIGSRIDVMTQNFIGDIDEVKIYDRVLTATEIAAINESCKYYTGITNQSSENLLSVFPNPFENYLLLSGSVEGKNLFLYDVLGKEVIRQTTSSGQTRINTEDLSKGIYFLRCVDEKNGINTNVTIIKN